MHKSRHRHRNNVGGSIGFAVLVLGILMFYGLYSGFFRYNFWPLPSLGVVIVILFIIGVSSSARRRARQRTAHQQGYKRYEPYKPTRNPYWINEENESIEPQKPEEKTVSGVFFCDYCGMKITGKMKFCSNCGNNLN